MSSDSIFNTSWNDVSEGEVFHTRLSVSALVSAILGLGTFLIYISLWFFFLGVIAILLSLAALWIIRNSEGIVTGTAFAYIGLCSAIVALVSIGVFWSAYQYGIRKEADQFFRLWFVAALQGDIPRIMEYQSIYANRSRAADAEEWWKTQYENSFSHRTVYRFVKYEEGEPNLVRVLMALGDNATVTYFKTSSVVSEEEADIVTSVYAVTFTAESGETETFFVRISGRRSYPRDLPDFKTAGWQIVGTPAFYLPDEFQSGINRCPLF